MRKDSTFLVIAFSIFIFSIFGLLDTYDSLVDFTNPVTGYASQTGIVNVSIAKSEEVDFTSSQTIDWGSGALAAGKSFGTIDTAGGVVNGTWGSVSDGFVIKNLGNVNVTLNLTVEHDADAFIGGVAPFFQYNVSDVIDDSCVTPGGFDLNTYYEVGASSVNICEILAINGSVRIDFKLGIPSNSNLGILSNGVTILHEGA